MKDSNLAAQKTEVSYLFLNKGALKLPVPQQSPADHLNLKRPPLPALESILFSSATPALLYCRNCWDENRAESSQKLNCMTHCIRWTGSVCRLVETDLQTTQNWQQLTRSVLSVSIKKKGGIFSPSMVTLRYTHCLDWADDTGISFSSCSCLKAESARVAKLQLLNTISFFRSP